MLLGHTIKKSREWMVTHGDDELSPDQLIQADRLMAKLLAGEPLPYLVGSKAFFGLDFIVTPGVLIPRPETEQLVEECIQWLEIHTHKRKIVDVGTGSGVIAVTLADHFDDANITAIDISPEALTIAKQNAQKYGVDQRIDFLQCDLFSGCSGRFDVIAANLPYIPSSTLRSLQVAQYEPLLALDGGNDGLDLIKKLLQQSTDKLEPGGVILLEIETSQAEAATQLADQYWPKAQKSILFDLAKHPRILKIYS